jgi:hypothetical protein
MTYRGREDQLDSAPPPSEPDMRISRIRLSRKWFTCDRVDMLFHRPLQEKAAH